MTAPIRILPGSRPLQSAQQGPQSQTTGSATGQEFNLLLQLIASLLVNNTSPAQQSQQEITNQPVAAEAVPGSGSNMLSPLGGCVSGENNQTASVNPVSSGGPSKELNTPGYRNMIAASYSSAAMTSLFAARSIQPAQNQSSRQSAADAGQTITGQVSTQNILQNLSALLASVENLPHNGGAIPAVQISSQEQGASQSSAGVSTQPPILNQDNSTALNADLLRLLSAASSGKLQGEPLSQFTGVSNNSEQASLASIQNLVRQLQDGAYAVQQKQGTSQPQSGLVQTMSAQIQKQGNAIVQDPGMTGISVLKMGSQPASTVVPQNIQVQTADNNPVSAAAPATMNQSVTPGNGTVTTSGQNAGQQNAPLSGQVQQAQAYQSGNPGQSPDDSQKALSNALRSGAGQIVSGGLDGVGGSSSFSQVIASASQDLRMTGQMPAASDIVQSIVKQVNMMAHDGKTVVNVKLEPDALGSVTLQVVSEGGKISAQFDVRTPDARAYLESSVPQMKQMLETNGVSLSHLSVSLSGGDNQSGAGRPQYRQGRQRAKFYGTHGADMPAAVSAGLARSFGYNTIEMQF